MIGPTGNAADNVKGERRWPMALAVLTSMFFIVAQPHHEFPILRWVIPAFEGVLLITIIAVDPGRIDDRSKLARRLTIGLIAFMVLAALWGTSVLIKDLIHGSSVTLSAASLLAAGATVWFANIVAFSLLYWELDCGGPAARAQQMPKTPDFAFPQQLEPEVTPAGWRPQYVDYFYLAFTSATAFSPTDAMPLVPWAKLSMALQQLISLVLFGLVVARAVNVFK